MGKKHIQWLSAQLRAVAGNKFVMRFHVFLYYGSCPFWMQRSAPVRRTDRTTHAHHLAPLGVNPSWQKFQETVQAEASNAVRGSVLFTDETMIEVRRTTDVDV